MRCEDILLCLGHVLESVQSLRLHQQRSEARVVLLLRHLEGSVVRVGVRVSRRQLEVLPSLGTSAVLLFPQLCQGLHVG